MSEDRKALPPRVAAALTRIEREAATLQAFTALLRDYGFSGVLVARSVRKFPSEDMARKTINRLMDDLDVSNTNVVGVMLMVFTPNVSRKPERTELQKIVDGAVSLDALVRLARRLPRRYYPECGLPSRSLLRACLRVFHYNNTLRLNDMLNKAALGAGDTED